jgi:tRNA threonylcarbamoyladenosine biosynthesis protein TsaB
VKILAVDSSNSAASVAICEDDKIISEFFINAGLTHSETLAPMIDASLKSSKITPQEIDLYSVTCGPGSFTGLRIGLATVKAMAFVGGKPCARVSSLEALAQNCLDFLLNDDIICVCVDAKCGGIYNALFRCVIEPENKKIIRLCEDRAIFPEDLTAELQNLEYNINFVGDGALMCYNTMGESFGFDNLKLAFSQDNYINAVKVAHLSKKLYDEGLIVSALDLNPNYIKIPQAERMLKENKLKIN